MDMPVPFLDLHFQHQQIQAQLEANVLHVLHSGHYILGPVVEEFEQSVAEYLNVPYAIAVSSGTDALLMALMALGIGPGDEVIVPDFSFVATAMVVLRTGAQPVFADIEPETLTLNPEQVRRKITDRTRALIPVHLYGQMAAMDELQSIAEEHNIAIIEDAAQAFGAEAPTGAKAGTIGIMGCFSFYPTKNLGAAGEAGLVVTKEPDLADRLRMIRNQGQYRRYESRLIGGNFRMDAIQAAVLKTKLPLVDQWNWKRIQLAQRYNELLEDVQLINFPDAPLRLASVRYRNSAIRFPHVYHQFIIFARQRDQLHHFLRQRGIETQIYYPVPFHQQPCFASLPSASDPFPIATAAARDVLALPLYPGLSETAQRTVVDTIRQFYNA